MKRILPLLLCICVLTSALLLPTFAHSGDTDASGGHVNHSIGKYHYHHGKPAHQHPNGVCPYDKPLSNIKIGDFIVFGFLGSIILLVVWGLISSTVDKIKCRAKTKKQKNRATASTVHPSSKPNQEKQDIRNVKEAPRPPEPPIPSTHRIHHGSEDAPIYSVPKQTNIVPRSIPAHHSVQPQHKEGVSRLQSRPPFVLDINAAYIPPSQIEQYLIALNSERASRAVTEPFELYDLHTNTDTEPFRVSCRVISKKGNIYDTSLTSCSCPDYKIRHAVCKHMLALAMKVNAITIDIELLKKAPLDSKPQTKHNE